MPPAIPNAVIPNAVIAKAVGANARAALARLAFSGLLGIGYEMLVVRVLSQVAEDTVYTFALLLAVYLVGTAAGAAACQRWLVPRDHARWVNRLLGATALACLWGTGTLWFAEDVKAQLVSWLGGGMVAALAAEAALALLAFGLPTLAMARSSACCACAPRPTAPASRAPSASTPWGAAAAPMLFGVLLAPVAGPKWALLLVTAGYLLLAAPRAWLTPALWLPAAATLAVALWAPAAALRRRTRRRPCAQLRRRRDGRGQRGRRR